MIRFWNYIINQWCCIPYKSIVKSFLNCGTYLCNGVAVLLILLWYIPTGKVPVRLKRQGVLYIYSWYLKNRKQAVEVLRPADFSWGDDRELLHTAVWRHDAWRLDSLCCFANRTLDILWIVKAYNRRDRFLQVSTLLQYSCMWHHPL